MKFIVKNVPPHKGGKEGEDLICSSTKTKGNRFKEIAHINDSCEEGRCCEPYDSNGNLFQHRIYDAPDIQDAQSMPKYLYMWVEYRPYFNIPNFNIPKKIELKDEPFCKYPVYEYSATPLMKK